MGATRWLWSGSGDCSREEGFSGANKIDGQVLDPEDLISRGHLSPIDFEQVSATLIDGCLPVRAAGSSVELDLQSCLQNLI